MQDRFAFVSRFRLELLSTIDACHGLKGIYTLAVHISGSFVIRVVHCLLKTPFD